MRNILNRLLCIILVIGIVIPLLGVQEIRVYASNEEGKTPYTMRISTTSFSYPNFNSFKFEYNIDLLNDMIKDVTKYPEYNTFQKWRMLVFYDKLSYGEIHRRVQDDIWQKMLI